MRPSYDEACARFTWRDGLADLGFAAAAVRAIVKTQRALTANPQLAAKAAQPLFPAEEASLIAYEIARDAPFYDPTITEEMVAHISRFAREVGTLDGEVTYAGGEPRLKAGARHERRL